ncbi:MAG: cation:H+ antiporter [Hyphomicrobiaceae bacterium]|jgi:cation:H+ antiporter
MSTAFISLIGGFILLIIGGELLVRGAVRTAERLGVSPLLIGLTLVGFGTSAPEMAISIQAAMEGSPGIAIGNFVGSSISNILLILGAAALLSPIAISSAALNRDGTFVLITAVIFAVVSLLLPYNQYVGWCFIALLGTYLTYAWRQERVVTGEGHTSAYEMAEGFSQMRDEPGRGWISPKIQRKAVIIVPLMLACVGLVGIILGGRLLVDGAVSIAKDFGISETVIGLTIVAVGTSMPELITSVVAAARGQPSVAVGTILGSNIYNILGVGGITAILAPTTVPTQIVQYDNLVMVAAALLLLLFARTGFRITRIEGSLLLACYVAYIWTLWPQ